MGQNTPRGNHSNSPSYAPEKGSRSAPETIFSNPCIVTLTFDLFDPKVHRAHTWLMGRLHVKFHEDRCKGEAVMRLKPFYLTARLQTDGRTGWFQYTPPNFVAGGITRERQHCEIDRNYRKNSVWGGRISNPFFNIVKNSINLTLMGPW